MGYYPPLVTQVSIVVDWSPGPPAVTTSAVTDIEATTATGNCEVLGDGGSTITERGICWIANSGTPTISDSKATHAGTVGVYDPLIAGLTAGTHYHARAYATNGIGTSYGALVEFNTAGVPTVTSQAVTGIGFTTATGSGTIVAANGGDITSNGVVWATHTINTEAQDWDGYFESSDHEGAFTAAMSSLPAGTHLYVRAYAANVAGYGFGTEVEFYTAGGGEYSIGGSDGDFVAPSSWGSLL